MEILNTHIGDVLTTEDITIRGILDGQLSVNAHHNAHIFGIVTKNVIAYKDSAVRINGIVKGDVINKGGIIEIYGIVNGRLTTIDGDTRVSPNAIVR